MKFRLLSFLAGCIFFCRKGIPDQFQRCYDVQTPLRDGVRCDPWELLQLRPCLNALWFDRKRRMAQLIIEQKIPRFGGELLILFFLAA